LAPAALTPRQKDLLESIQRRIRSSQKRNKDQEGTMTTTPVTRIIVNLEDGGEEAQVSFGRDGCDPVIMPPVALGEHRLPELLAQVPVMLAQAKEQWTQSPPARSSRSRHQAQPPADPGTEPQSPTQPEAELPLLAGAETQPEPFHPKLAEPEPVQTEPIPETSQPEEFFVDQHQPAPADLLEGLDGGDASASGLPEAEPESEPAAEPEPQVPMVSGPTLALGVAGVEERMAEAEQVGLFAGLDEPPSLAEPEPAQGQSSGGWEYYLKDGRGPYGSTLEALDALGVPQEGRGGYWNRHDRLPKKYQDQIERRAKA
jgi:hypothetical protein